MYSTYYINTYHCLNLNHMNQYTGDISGGKSIFDSDRFEDACV